MVDVTPATGSGLVFRQARSFAAGVGDRTAVTKNERMGYNLLKVAGVAAIFGYPLYKKYSDKVPNASVNAFLGWAAIGLSVFLVADQRVHCADSIA